MPRKSVEARLQSLQDKRDALAAEIRKIQTEKARELRKRQRQREALVGRAIYQLVANGAVITTDTWTEEFLTQLVNTQLTRQCDRQLFGLEPIAKPKGNKTVVQYASEETVKAAQKPTHGSVDKSAKKNAIKVSTSLPTSSSEESLINEFNL